ncbi:hypothetical protein DL96DRAFT_1789116 [Flagelloscypha sp. PMI_526]|nr:hypothetical protein DL96DRAFT_1789116 [Flagelloscypha sp. PMI_526]
MRKLSLHPSALNDEEYTQFTASFSDLAQSEEYESDASILTSREVRAWVRGRYPMLDVATLDSILKLFGDRLSSGEFFAGLRLILHATEGKTVDRSLAFVQTHPGSQVITFPSSSTPRNGPQTAPLSNGAASLQTPENHHNPFRHIPPKPKSDTSAGPPLPPRKPPMPPPQRSSSAIKPVKHTPSTLIQQSLLAQKTAQSLKKAEEMLEKERVLQVLKRSSMPIAPTPSAHNKGPPPAVPGRRNRSTSPSKPGGLEPPPLPRRRVVTGASSVSSSSSVDPTESPPESLASFREVALAGTNSSTPPARKPTNPFPRRSSQPNGVLPTALGQSRSPSPTRRAPPPPMHPDLTASSITTTSTPSKAPIPPPKPKRLSSLSSGVRMSRPQHRKTDSEDVFSTSEEEEDGFVVSTDTGGTITPRRSRSVNGAPSTASSPFSPPVPSRKRRVEDVFSVSEGEQDPFVTAPNTPTTPRHHQAHGVGIGGANLTRSKTSPSAHPSPASNTHRRQVSETTAPFLNAQTQRNIVRTLDTIRFKAEAGLSPKRGFIPDRSLEDGESLRGGGGSLGLGKDRDNSPGAMAGRGRRWSGWRDDVDFGDGDGRGGGNKLRDDLSEGTSADGSEQEGWRRLG